MQQHTLGTICGHSLNVGSCEQQLDPAHSPPVAVVLWQQQGVAGALQQLQPWYSGNHMAQGHLQWYIVSAAHSTQPCSSGGRDAPQTQAELRCSTSSSSGSTSSMSPGSVGGSHPWASSTPGAFHSSRATLPAGGACHQQQDAGVLGSSLQRPTQVVLHAFRRWPALCCTGPVDVGQRHAGHRLPPWTALFAQAFSSFAGHVDACSCRPLAYPREEPAWPAWMVLLRLLTVMCDIITAGASKHAVMTGWFGV